MMRHVSWTSFGNETRSNERCVAVARLRHHAITGVVANAYGRVWLHCALANHLIVPQKSSVAPGRRRANLAILSEHLAGFKTK